MAADSLVHQVETDYFLAGDLSDDQIKEVASSGTYKTWICLLSGDDQAKIKSTVTSSSDVNFVNIPLNMPDGMTTDTARQMEQAMHYVQKPVIVQCKSATRASAALAIHYADANMFGAQQVHDWAAGHNLKYVGNEALKQWVGECADSRVKLTQELRAHYEPQQLIFRQLFDRTSCTYTYLLACPTTLEGVLIDPVDTLVQRDTAIIREMGIKLKYGMNTHVHADHITGTGLLKREFPGMQSVLSKASGGQADKHVEPGEKITFGSLFLEVRATPGHTPGCVTYVLGEAQSMAFTGDALLIRGCGRTDFQGGSSDTLYDSVHNQIFTLPGECIVYPGHDYRGRTASTVYEERQFNPRLTHGKEKYIHIMETLGLPDPKMLDVAVPANLVCGLHEVHGVAAQESKE